MTRSSGKQGILYLDIEGGWGGSSRSLYYLIEALDRDTYEPVVLVRKKGPVADSYANLGVECVYAPDLPAFRPSERKNPVAFALFLIGLRKFFHLLKQSRQLARVHRIRLLHVNHESLTLTGFLIARSLRLPWFVHNRTLLIPGWFTRRVHTIMMRHAARIICIIDPVRDHIKASAGRAFNDKKTVVVHNIVPSLPKNIEPLKEMTRPPDRFRILSLTNFSPNRGVDRIIDIAEELNGRGDERFAFYLCGRPANTNALTGKVDPYYGQILDRVSELGLTNMVFFPGHLSQPERALASCDALIKLTRQANPWGRDIMEALSAGLPVITQGNYHGLVEPGVNGYMESEYRPAAIADYLQRLADDPRLYSKISKANREKVSRLFDASRCACEMECHYEAVLNAMAAET